MYVYDNVEIGESVCVYVYVCVRGTDARACMKERRSRPTPHSTVNSMQTSNTVRGWRAINSPWR